MTAEELDRIAAEICITLCAKRGHKYIIANSYAAVCSRCGSTVFTIKREEVENAKTKT